MLQLLSPLALFGLAALAIPAILHLWRPPPTVVRVGTLRFFTGPAVRRLTKLRWRELLLLAVRLLLLALLALLLAQPIWRKDPPTEPQRWALIEPGVVLQGDALDRRRELDKRGFEARELARGFGRIAVPLETSENIPEAADVWSLLREADARLPAGSEVVVFASDRLASLVGERPAMQRCKVDWVSSSGRGRAEKVWIDSVELVRPASDGASKLRIDITRSNATQTETTTLDLDVSAGKTALTGAMEGRSIEVTAAQDDTRSARVVRDDNATPAGAWIRVAEHKPLRVAILHAESRAEDAGYVRAAIRAMAETSGREIALGNDAAHVDRIFWLNDEPLPNEIAREAAQRGAILLSDAEQSGEVATAVASSIEAQALPHPVALFRRVPATGGTTTALWTDGFGAPLLSLAREGAGLRARFFSRFHPDWNDLPRSSALAVILQPLLLEESNWRLPVDAQDQRRVDPAQGRPAEARGMGSGAEVVLPATGEIVDLHMALWLTCIALFAVERTLSHGSRSPIRSEPAAALAPREPALVEHA